MPGHSLLTQMDDVPTDGAHRSLCTDVVHIDASHRWYYTQRQMLLTETDVHQEHDVHQKLPQGGLDIKFPVLSSVLSQGCSPKSYRAVERSPGSPPAGFLSVISTLDFNPISTPAPFLTHPSPYPLAESGSSNLPSSSQVPEADRVKALGHRE